MPTCEQSAILANNFQASMCDGGTLERLNQSGKAAQQRAMNPRYSFAPWAKARWERLDRGVDISLGFGRGAGRIREGAPNHKGWRGPILHLRRDFWLEPVPNRCQFSLEEEGVPACLSPVHQLSLLIFSSHLLLLICMIFFPSLIISASASTPTRDSLWQEQAEKVAG